MTIIPHENVNRVTSEIIPFVPLAAEQIDAPRVVIRPVSSSLTMKRVDISSADYRFWDALRRGQVPGLELSGTLAKTVGSKKAAWVLGMMPRIRLQNEKAEKLVNDWWGVWHPSILRAYNEACDLGDCYLVLNGDMSLTVIPPNMVTRIVNPKDFSQFWGYRIQMRIPNPLHPEEEQIIEDWYFANARYHLIRDSGGTIIDKTRYENVVGRIPVIHIANRKGADEINGRPEAEGLLNVLYRYGDILEAAAEGNIRQGRPTPVIEGMGTPSQLNAFWERFGRMETQVNPVTGETEQVLVIPFDPDVLMTIGGDGKFKYAQPGSFSQDTLNLLEILFYLMVQHSEIPEFVWGAAIGASKASAESQVGPFLKWVKKQRGEAMTWIREITDLVLAYYSFYERAARNQTPSFSWRPIATTDGRIALDTVIWAWNKGLFSDREAVWYLPLDIDNPEEVLEDAPEVSPEVKMALLSLKARNDAGQGGSVSSGGQPQNNRKQENPQQPTERNG